MAVKGLVKKTRRPRDPFKPKVERELTHISAEQALTRHLYCVPARFALGVAYCDHPQDGWCRVGMLPTLEELQEINNRLAGKGSETSVEMSTPSQVRTRQRRSEPKMAQFFCMECERWHREDDSSLDGPDSSTPGVIRSKITGIYLDHAQYKRKRGQRLPSQLKPKTPAKYFCTKCNDWHQELMPAIIDSRETIDTKFTTHAKHKRKRGRQKGWKKAA